MSQDSNSPKYAIDDNHWLWQHPAMADHSETKPAGEK